MYKLRRLQRNIIHNYLLHKKRILIISLISPFFISFITHLFKLEDFGLFLILLTVYSTLFIIVATKIGLYMYRKVHLFLRYIFLGVSFYLLSNYERFTEPDNIITNFISDILNLILFTAFLLILIVIVDFIFDFIKWYKSMTNKTKLMFDVCKTLVVIFFIGTAIYTVWSINNINRRLNTIELRFGGSSKVSCNEKEAINKLNDSVVRVVGGVAEGSGFVIKENGLIMTNFHVIEFEPSPKVVFPDNTFETAEIKYADKQADLAILSIKRPMKAIVWGDSDGLELTEELIALGYPFGGELVGDISVNTGKMAARRYSKVDGIEYIQIDGTLNQGVSGGPLINVCGEVVGVNTAGTAGLGLAISSKSAQSKWLQMLSNDDPLKDIERIVFEPNKSPLDAVTSFYNYLKIRKMEEAYELLSDNFLEGGSFENWKIGYESLLDTTVIKIEDDPEQENFVNVKLSTKDLIDDEIVYKYFEGRWEIREIDGNLKLWQPKIKEVAEPDWEWFY